MELYKAIITYELDDNNGVCQKEYNDVYAGNEIQARQLATSFWSMDVIWDTVKKAKWWDCKIVKVSVYP